MLSGLPGTGKDVWIRQNCSDMPQISLDVLRMEMGISASDAQGKVIHAAHELARGYLRKHQPFVWNATSLTADLRKKQVSLFENYGAAVRIVFLETGWKEELRRNQGRQRSVSEAVIEKMLNKLEPPKRWEAQEVEWYCV